MSYYIKEESIEVDHLEIASGRNIDGRDKLIYISFPYSQGKMYCYRQSCK